MSCQIWNLRYSQRNRGRALSSQFGDHSLLPQGPFRSLSGRSVKILEIESKMSKPRPSYLEPFGERIYAGIEHGDGHVLAVVGRELADKVERPGFVLRNERPGWEFRVDDGTFHFSNFRDYCYWSSAAAAAIWCSLTDWLVGLGGVREKVWWERVGKKKENKRLGWYALAGVTVFGTDSNMLNYFELFKKRTTHKPREHLGEEWV